MDERTQVDVTSGPPWGRDSTEFPLALSFFGNPSAALAHRRLALSLRCSHGFLARNISLSDLTSLLPLSDDLLLSILPPRVSSPTVAPSASPDLGDLSMRAQ